MLVVDDDALMRHSVQDALTAEGFQVAIADSGAAALKLAREIRFDVVLCDLRMVGLSGEDTLASLKAIDPEMEVVMGTAYASVDSAVECMRRGAFDYLIKPYAPDALTRVIRRALEYSRLHGAVELSDAARAIALVPAAELPTRLPQVAQGLFRSDAAALVLQRGNQLEVFQAQEAGPSGSLVRGLAIRGLQTSAPFRFVSPRSENLVLQEGDDAYAAGLVCALRTAQQTEGALVLLRKQGSPPFSIAVVRRVMTFASLGALAVAAARNAPTHERQIPEAVGRLLREARQGVAILSASRLTGPGQQETLDRLVTVVSALEKLLG